jgi:DNA-binding SARP family transcriptional activator
VVHLLASSAGIEFRILGPLEVLDEGKRITPDGSKQRALLALFLLHANETLTTDRLIDELWGGRAPASAANTVHVHISRLRKALAAGAGNGVAGDGLVVTRGRGYELRIEPEQLDSLRFERLLAEGRSGLAADRPEQAISALGAALSLWRGSPLAELAHEPFANAEVARLEELRVEALELLIEAKLALGRHAEVVGELETLIGEYPYRERLRAQLMLALYRCDRQADALEAYQDARRKLVGELGIEPSDRLRQLERAILTRDPALAVAVDASRRFSGVQQTVSGALERGQEAFERRAWELAFEELLASDAQTTLAAEDLERLGEAARWSRHFEDMLDAFERCVAAYESVGDRQSAARVAVKLALEHYARHGDALAAGWLARAQRLLEGEPACRERGLVLMCIAMGMFTAGDVPAAVRVSQEVVELGRALEDRDVEALGHICLGHARLVGGEVSEGAALIDEAMAAALGGELELWTTGQIFCSMILTCRNRGDLGRAGEWSVATLRWCERHSLSGFPGLCRFHRAEVMRFRGALDRAEGDASEAVEELLAAAPRWAGWALHELGEIRRRRGDLKGAAEFFRHSAALGFDPQPGLALLRLDEGKPTGARRAIVEALAVEDGLIREGRWLLLPAAVEIGLAAGDAGLAGSALEELDALAEALETTAVRAAASMAKGRVALSQSRLDDAVRDLRQGIRLWSDIEAPYEAAQGRELLAAAYGRLDDPDAAELELAAAGATFERMDAEGAAHRVAGLRSRGGAGPDEHSSGARRPS